MSAVTRAAGRVRNDRACIHQRLDIAFRHCLLEDGLAAWCHDHSHTGRHLPANEYLGRYSKILDPSIRAGTDKGLVDLRFAKLSRRRGVVGHFVRQDDQRFKRGDINPASLLRMV